MRINPITTLNSLNYSIEKKQNLSDAKPNNSINFKSIPLSKPPKVVRKASILDKLTIAFNKIENDDLLILSNSVENGKKYLKKYIDEISAPIAKLVLMVVPGVSDALAFEKCNNQKAIWNMGKNSIIVDDKVIKPNDATSLKENSLILFKEGEIDFSRKPDNLKELEVFANYFLEEYDSTSKYENIVYNYNKEFLNDILDKKDAAKRNSTEKTVKKEQKSSKRCYDFSSIGGQNHIVDDIKRNIIFPLKYPEAFEGFQTNRGVIFYGPPGTGKSLMADIICSESGASCFKIAGAELESELVGKSEKNWRELHQKAVDSQPSIIFVDEIDAVARNRSGKDTYGDKVLNQVLALMSDDEKSNRNIFWIGATNKVESLDNAITRSGRFGKRYEFLPPSTIEDVEQIFNIHTKKIKLSNSIDKNCIFSQMLKLKTTGADIKMLVDDARMNAFERMEIFKSMDNGTYSPLMLDFLEVTDQDFDKAIANFGKNKKVRQQVGFIK